MLRSVQSGSVPAEVAAAAGQLRQQTRQLLPAALLLFATQVLAIARGFDHLGLVEGVALVGTTGWTAASIVCFVSLLRRTQPRVLQTAGLEGAETSLTSTTSRLLVGACANSGFGVLVLTGSWFVAAFIA